jgi:diguanylate cyclase (GGDEF)-like protein/PAS domain S-box-containing protein
METPAVLYNPLLVLERLTGDQKQMAAYNLDDYFEVSPDLLCILDSDAAFVRVNPAFTDILGWTADEIVERHFLDFVHPDSIEKSRYQITTLTQDNTPVSFANRYRCKDSTYRFLRWSLFCKEGVLFGNGIDITELSETYELFNLLIENSPTGMILVDHKGVIQIANREAARIFGYSKNELINQCIEILLPDKIKPTHTQMRENYTINPQSRPMGTGRDLHGQHKEGHRIDVEVGLNPIKIERGTFILSTIIDLTQRKRSEESMIHFTEQLEESIQELTELASTDSLTQLNNRRAFSNHLTNSLQTSARMRGQISLLLIDIDDFKSYNDSFGHPAGDHLLIEIARLLKRISRVDDFIARIGGEEFAVVLPNTGKDASVRISKRYLKAFSETNWPRRSVTASIGAASNQFMDAEMEDLVKASEKLLQEADQALYASKTRGKNRVTHFEALLGFHG